MGKGSLAEIAYEKTKEKIIYGNLSPGDIVTVGDLAIEYCMSKTPVRDALNKLKNEGLLKLLPYKGYIVSQIDLKDMEELFSIRILLEGAVAELAAINANQEQIERLYNLASYDFNNVENSEIVFMKVNFDFHVTVAEASGNKRLKNLISNTMSQMLRVLYLDLKAENPQSMNIDHMEIVDAIKNRNPDLAKQLAIRHIEKSKIRIFSH